MRKGWTETSLGPLVTLRTGKLDVNAGVEDGEFPFFTCSRDTYKIDVAAYSGKSVIVAGNGDLNVKYYEGEFNAYQRTYILQAIDESVLNPTFLFHFMEKYVETLRNDTQGSTIQYLKKAQFAEAPIVLPPLAEQKRIVDVVSSVDAYIDALQQQADTARAARNSVLHELLSAGGDGWTETTLGGVAIFYNGKAYKQDELLAAGRYRVLRVGNFFSNGNWYWSDLELDANKYCDNGDLLYAWSASFGPRIWTDEKVIYHYHIWKVEENPLLVEKKFLYYWLEDDVQRMKRDAGTGSIMMHITKGEMEARAVSLPSLGEQKRIVEIVSSIDEVIQSTKQAVMDAKNLRSGLLSDLLSGEHEIPASYDLLLGAA